MFMNMHMLFVCIYDTCISIYDIYIYTHVCIYAIKIVYMHICAYTHTHTIYITEDPPSTGSQE